MSEEEMLQAGISALRSGDKARAKALLAQLVKENPLSEQGWYLLGMSVASLEQREYCYKRVLAINPNNQDAKKQLGLLVTPAPSAADWLSQLNSREEPPQAPKVSQPISTPFEPYVQPVSPFAYEDLKSDLVREEKEAFVSRTPLEKLKKESQRRIQTEPF